MIVTTIGVIAGLLVGGRLLFISERIAHNHLIHVQGALEDIKAQSVVQTNRIIAATDAGTDQLKGLRSDIRSLITKTRADGQ